MAGERHGTCEEARVQQMQNRVLDAADILINRQPLLHRLQRRRVSFVERIGEPGKIPGGIDEGVHRVGFAARRTAAFRTGDVAPGRMAVERVAGLVEAHILRQHHRQLGLRHGEHATSLAVDDRDRTTPVALARDAPVAQSKLNLPRAPTLFPRKEPASNPSPADRFAQWARRPNARSAPSRSSAA